MPFLCPRRSVLQKFSNWASAFFSPAHFKKYRDRSFLLSVVNYWKLSCLFCSNHVILFVYCKQYFDIYATLFLVKCWFFIVFLVIRIWKLLTFGNKCEYFHYYLIYKTKKTVELVEITPLYGTVSIPAVFVNQTLVCKSHCLILQ